VLLAKYTHCARMTDYNDVSDRWKILDGLRSLMNFCYTITNVAMDECVERCAIFRMCTIATVLSPKSNRRTCYLLCTTMYKLWCKIENNSTPTSSILIILDEQWDISWRICFELWGITTLIDVIVRGSKCLYWSQSWDNNVIFYALKASAWWSICEPLWKFLSNI
jgi:hypothetical protein